MSFATQHIASIKKSHLSLVLSKTKDGVDAWWYVLVDSLKKSIFEKDMKKGAVDLANYGKIIKSGYGETPPEVVCQEMADEHGFIPEET